MLNMVERSCSVAEDPVFATVEDALDDLRAGKFVIVLDSRDPDSEGDLVIAAERCTAQSINFMVTEATGIVFLCLPADRVEELGLRPMAPHGDPDSWKQAMTVSIEARHGVTTGISAHDRAHTIQVASDPRSGPEDLVRPGHVFPLAARNDGVLERAGRTEAHVDLARLAGFNPAAVAVEIVTEDGANAHVEDLVRFGHRHDIRILAVGDVVSYRWRTERLLERGEERSLHTRAGDFRAITLTERTSGVSHTALVRKSLDDAGEVTVALHSECLIGDVFGSTECDCADSFATALERLAAAPRAVLVYVRSPASKRLVCGALEPERAADVGAQALEELGVDAERVVAADPNTASLLGRAR